MAVKNTVVSNRSNQMRLASSTFISERDESFANQILQQYYVIHSISGGARVSGACGHISFWRPSPFPLLPSIPLRSRGLEVGPFKPS